VQQHFQDAVGSLGQIDFLLALASRVTFTSASMTNHRRV
jgi:hypothetical protein